MKALELEFTKLMAHIVNLSVEYEKFLEFGNSVTSHQFIKMVIGRYGNNHPVLIISNIGEVLGFVMQDNVSSFIDFNLPSSTHVFRTNKSTKSAVCTLLVNEYKNGKDDKHRVAFIALNFYSAFD